MTMKKLKISFVFALLIALIGCTDRGLREDTSPIVEPEGTGNLEEIEEVPTTIDIIITYPPNSDKIKFQRAFGKLLGLKVVSPCQTDHDSEKWTIDYVNMEDFETLISSIFDSVDLLDPNTTSNGPGGNQPYAVYSVGNTTTSSSGTEYFEYYRFVYNGACQ